MFKVAPECPRDSFMCQKWGVMEKGNKIGRPYATAGKLGTGQVLGAHTSAGGQCANATQAGVGADGPARIHTGKGKRRLWAGERWDGTAYVTIGIMPSWMSRMTSSFILSADFVSTLYEHW